MKHHLFSLMRVSDDKTTLKNTLKVPSRKKLQLQEQLCANVVIIYLASSCPSLFALQGSSEAKKCQDRKQNQ